jgi:hypothetical protein
MLLEDPRDIDPAALPHASTRRHKASTGRPIPRFRAAATETWDQ